MLVRARESAKSEGLGNMGFLRADAQHLPIADGALDLCVTSYSLHHIPDQQRVVREMARVVKPGGRVGIVDILVPDAPGASEAANAIEIARDPSHTQSLMHHQFMALLDQAGLRLIESKYEETERSFDHWLHVAGWHRGDERYEEARRLMEETLESDAAGFHPKFVASDPANPSAEAELWLCNNALYIAAEKI
jgi:ubiquinone/menaquinone biosynthesis C-methylase UbiE